QVDEFILGQIESVPHLEALLLLWNSRPRQWSLEQVAGALYISAQSTVSILQDLQQRGLIHENSGNYSYNSEFKPEHLIHEVDMIYRRELIRVSRMIHSKAPSSVREFARAFKFKKD